MKLKRQIKFLSVIMSGVLACFSSSAFGFGSESHRYITKYSIEKLGDMSKNLLSEQKINEKEFSTIENMKDKYKNVIINYSLKPDEDENQGGYKKHFYNPVTERNFLGEKETACLKCLEHYSNAINYHIMMDGEKEYEELGRAIHFLEDANTCVHTGYVNPTDSVIKFPLHVKFENKCDLVKETCSACMSPESLDYYKSNSLENIIKSSAILSMDNFYRLENTDEEMEDLACNAILNAQKKIIGLLYRFANEVSN